MATKINPTPTLKGKDANVFLIRKFVDWAFGGQFVVKTMNEIVDDVKDVAEDVKEAIDNKKEDVSNNNNEINSKL